MESLSILPVARTSGPLRLVTPEGDPVWPARSAAEFDDLRQLAAVFGTRLEQIPPCPASVQPGYRDEVVWGLGKQAFAAAELYAHLTSRSLRLVDRGESTAGLVFASVVVTTIEMLTYDLLERLSARAPGHPIPGIIAAAPEALHRQVILRSAAAALSGPVRERRIDVAPTVQARSNRRRAARVLCEGDPAEQVREALGAGAGLLNILTHSDGVDACFGAATMCPMEAVQESFGATPPMCIVRGICHRHQLSLDDATLASFLIRPREVAARLVVFHTCKGILPADATVDPNWGLLPRLLDQARIGAVATTWEMTLSVEKDLDRVAAGLEKGVPVGEALAHFMNMKPVRQRNVRMCLFGDPRLCLPASSRISKNNPASSWRPNAGELAFLEAYLRLKSRAKSAHARLLIRTANKALAPYAARASNGRLAKSAADTAGRPVREALLDLFCNFGSTPSSDWNQFAVVVRSFRSPSPCPQCGMPTHTWIMRILRPKCPKRRMINCPRCGFIEDAPMDYPQLALRLEGPLLRLAGQRPHSAWSARVLIDPGLPKDESPPRRWLDWPAGADGSPARYFEIGDCLEHWPMNVTLLLIEGLSLVALTCRVRA
jgi:hypothetical protein